MAGRRDLDPSFASSERLWRRIEPRDVDKDGRIKSGSLRPQFSVVREKHGALGTVPHGKWNGVAEVSAGDATDQTGRVHRVCIDEPTIEQQGHALIAIVADLDAPGITPEEIDQKRAELSNRFLIVQQPKKV